MLRLQQKQLGEGQSLTLCVILVCLSCVTSGLAVLPVARRARYDSNIERVECLEDTRTDILDGIKNWILSLSTPTSDFTIDPDCRILWLNGLAGTGKTTIAYTIAKWCDETEKMLAASFFCSRSDADCNDPGKIFTTIAFQLAGFHPPYKKVLADVLRRSPDIVNAAPPHHLEDLIVKPLHDLPNESKLPSCGIVIDALDECRDPKIVFSILLMLLRFSDKLPSLRFLVTSRPEDHISRSFNSQIYGGASHRFPLHGVPLGRVERDINRYLQVRLSPEHMELQVPAWWPDQQAIRHLTVGAHGLFIYAATCVRFISSGDPPSQMKLLTGSGPSDSSPRLLDDLYQTVLEIAISNLSNSDIESLRFILGSIVLAREPLSPTVLATLLGLETYQVLNVLRGLHAVLAIPRQHDPPDATIQIIHPTFIHHHMGLSI